MKLVRSLLAAALVAVVGGGLAVATTASPATAATCGSGQGISVVVDSGSLGRGTFTACDLNGAGRYAASNFTDTGNTLTYVHSQPGFVCRVNGAPSTDPCQNTPPTNAYWALFWADGKGGGWVYASAGVGSLKVPEGGYVALAWQSSTSRRNPAVTPTAHASSPPSSRPPTTASATSKPSSQPKPPPAPPSNPPSPSSSTFAPVLTPTPDPTAPLSPGPTTKPRKHTSPSAPGASATPLPATPGTTGPTSGTAPVIPPQEPPASSGGSSVGPWLAGAVVVVLLGAAALITRRRGARQ